MLVGIVHFLSFVQLAVIVNEIRRGVDILFKPRVEATEQSEQMTQLQNWTTHGHTLDILKEAYLKDVSRLEDAQFILLIFHTFVEETQVYISGGY